MRTGIRRKVDDLGRVVIPAGVRRSLNIREGDEVEVSVEGDQVILAKPIDQCVFCGSVEALSPFRGKRVCRACLAGLGVMDDTLRTPLAGADGDSGAPLPDDSVLPPWSLDEERPARTPRPAPAPVAPAADTSPPRPPARIDPPAQPPRQDVPESTTAW